MKVDRISNLLLNGMTSQKVHSRLYFPIKLVNATMQTKAVSTQVGKIAELCAVAIPSSLEVLMMRNKNNILLNTYAVEVRMNCYLFMYLVETAVPPKLDDHLEFFPPGRYNIFHKKTRCLFLSCYVTEVNNLKFCWKNKSIEPISAFSNNQLLLSDPSSHLFHAPFCA